jgi:hypothetical protein
VDDDSDKSEPQQEPSSRPEARDLPPDQFREVIRLARKGEIHPDPQVAAMAVAWAKAVLAMEPMRPEAFGKKRSRIVVELAGLFGEGNSGPMLIDGLRRRNADLIMGAAALHPAGQDPPNAE